VLRPTGLVDRPVELIIVAERLLDPLRLEVRLAAVQRVNRVLRGAESREQGCEVVRRATRAAVGPDADGGDTAAGIRPGVRRSESPALASGSGPRRRRARAARGTSGASAGCRSGRGGTPRAGNWRRRGCRGTAPPV